MDEQGQEPKTHIIKKVVKVIKRPIAVKAPEAVPVVPDTVPVSPVPDTLGYEEENFSEISDNVVTEDIIAEVPEYPAEENILPEELPAPLEDADIEDADIFEAEPLSEISIPQDLSTPPETENAEPVEAEPIQETVSFSEPEPVQAGAPKSIFDDDDDLPPSVSDVKEEEIAVAEVPEPEPEETVAVSSSAPQSIFDDDDDGDILPTPPVHTHEVRDIHDFAEDISIPESYQAKEASNPEIPAPVATPTPAPVAAPAPIPSSAPKIPPAPVAGRRVTPPPSVGLRTPPPPPLKTNTSHMFQEVHTDFSKEPAKPPEIHTRQEEIKTFPEAKAEYKEEPAANNPAYPTDTRYPNTENISSGLYDDNFAVRFNLPPKVLTTKYMSFIFGGILLFGIILGAFMGGGDSCSNQPAGLTGVIANPEVPRGRMRCGIAEKGQGCVLYLMNYQRRDVQAKDFYPLVAQMTGVQRFQIETGNMRYAYTTIKPGYIAQFNVPPVR